MAYGRKSVGGSIILPTIIANPFNFNSSSSFPRRKRRVKKSMSRRKSRSRKSKAHKTHIKHRRKHRTTSGRKRRGMSAAFLRELRRKHHLGEFKK